MCALSTKGSLFASPCKPSRVGEHILMQERERDIQSRAAAVAAREAAAEAREMRCAEFEEASRRRVAEANARADAAQVDARRVVCARPPLNSAKHCR
jgi:hypothetical protein